MEFGPDPGDRDDVIQRYGRRLFVLAYHLTGDAAEAAELSLECLVRGLLAPDFPSSGKEAGIYLHRGLISLWRERADQVRRGANLRVVGGAAGWESARPPKEHPGLWLALSRLDAVSRAVLVLRVAGGLEY
jgi:DNA-directed RNA polymerase specialized sigma24 family protein